MVGRPVASQDEVRRHNVSTLLRYLHVDGPQSRAELTSRMGLNRSTIKALVRDLAEAGLVAEQLPETRIGVGRPSHVVLPRPRGACVLAADVGVDSAVIAVIGIGGEVLQRRTYGFAGVGSKPDVVIGRLTGELRAAAERLDPQVRLVGVGVSLPGIVRARDGFVDFAPNLQWHGVPLGESLRARLGLDVEVRVGNDADLGALAEHVRGAGRDVANMLYLAGDVGIGGGMIFDGRMVHGAGGYAGEIGHMAVTPGGRRCRCGSSGCFETEVGEEALLLAAGADPAGGRPAADAVIAFAVAGEPVARAAVDAVGRALGRGVGSLVNVLNPEMVILGGYLASVFEVAEPAIRRALDACSLPEARAQVRLSPPGLGADSSLLGAAELAFTALLEDPTEVRRAG